MRLAVIANHDPTDVRKWSGTPYYAWSTLAAQNPGAVLINTPLIDKAVHFANKFSVRLGLDLFRFGVVTRMYAAHAERALRRHDVDALISIGATHKVADLNWDGPIFHVTDALYATVLAQYPKYQKLRGGSIRRGDVIQRRALNKINTVFLSSSWAAKDAQVHYPEYAAKMQHVPFGANLPDPGEQPETAKQLKLLMVGGDWPRKGGPRVLEVFRKLRARFPDCTIDIVGCDPALGTVAGVTVHGRLDKDDPTDAATLTRLYREAAFLIVLSKSEAFGIVFCEASAYAVPSIGSRVGGIPTVVAEGETGLLFDLGDPADMIAGQVADLWLDQSRYAQFSRAARAKFVDELNWPAWGRRISAAAKAALAG